MNDTSNARESPRLAEAPIAHDLGLLISLAAADSLKLTIASLEPYGLMPRPFAILGIAASGTHPTQRDLAEFLRVDPSQIVAILDDLEGRGLIERQVSHTDRRANVVVATEAGRTLFESSLVNVRRANRTSLPPEDEERLRLLLDRLVHGGA